ncbi:MAG: MATE family efflux transporter [Gracilibacteraceae bacterium]|jgi:Na+-driven multidrug efflux pump|nr:MATE family efflux transporter [Gracilibacteraceae bacterium]
MNESTITGENPLATQKVNGLILKYGIPTTISLLISALYNIVDQIFVGQGVGMLGNAATNVAFPFSTVCTALFLLIGVGAASNFNLNMGAGNKEKASHFVGTGISLLAICGILVGILVAIFLEPLLHLFGSTEQVLPLARTYTSIVTVGFPFLIFSSGVSTLIRADGSPTYSMFCVLSGAIVNTILDPIFIFGFDMGMAGAALATIISQFISFIFALYYLLKKFQTFRITKAHLIPKFDCVKGITAIGMSACLNQLAMAVVQVVMNNTLTYYGGLSEYGQDIPLACVGVISRVNIIITSLTFGIAQGCQPIFGFNYGAKNYGRVKETLKKAGIVIAWICVAAFICFQIFPRQIVSIFGQGNETYFKFAERYFRIFMFMTFINGIIPLTTNFLTSIGKAKKGIVFSISRQIIFLLPLITVLPIVMGIDGLMYAGPISDFLAAVMAVILGYPEIKRIVSPW